MDLLAPIVRPMRREDLKEVLRLIRLHDSDDYRAAKRAFDSERFDHPEAITAHFVVEDPEERRVVGVSGYFIDDDEAQGIYWLGWTYVNPFFRGRGLGKILMRHVEATLLGLGARKLYLSTSSLESYAAAVRFYERCGLCLEATLKDYYRVGEHKLILAKRLSRAALTEAPRALSSSAPGEARARPVERREEEEEEPTVFEF